jgi:hypothetical protein
VTENVKIAEELVQDLDNCSKKTIGSLWQWSCHLVYIRMLELTEYEVTVSSTTEIIQSQR